MIPVEFLQEYFERTPDALVVNLRARRPDAKGFYGEFFTARQLREEPEVVEQWIARRIERDELFFTPAACKPGTSKKVRSSGCAALADLSDSVEDLFVDADSPPDIRDDAEKLAAWKQEAAGKLRTAGARYVIDTGNGVHGHFRLATPVGHSKAKSILADLVRDLDGDVGAKGLSQCARLPGGRTKAGGQAAVLMSKPSQRFQFDNVVQFRRRDDDDLERMFFNDEIEGLLLRGEDKDGKHDNSVARFRAMRALILAGAGREEIDQLLQRDDLAITPKQSRGKIDNPKWRDKEINAAEGSVGSSGYVAELNQQYAVTIYGNESVLTSIDEETGKIDFFPVHYPVAFYENDKVEVRGRRVNKFKAWMKHRLRRTYKKVVFKPNEKPGLWPSGLFNSWQGFIDECDDPNLEAWLAFVFEIICDGDVALFDYTMKFLARLVQKPHLPGEVAFVMKGKKGTGKGTFVSKIAEMFVGDNFLHISNPVHLTGRFNAHLDQKLVVFGDEVFFAGDKKHEGVLKALITEQNVFVERKHVNGENVTNRMTIFLASNSDWTIPASMDERRYCVANVSEGRMQDHDYFEKVRNVKAGAILKHLRGVDISAFNHRAPPNTEGLKEQKRESFDPFDKWLIDYLTEGEVPVELQDADASIQYCPTRVMFDDYMRRYYGRARAKGEAPDSLRKFAVRIREMCPGSFPRPAGKLTWTVRSGGMHGQDKTDTANNYRWPMLPEWRTFIDKKLQQKFDWPEIGEQIDAFKK